MCDLGLPAGLVRGLVLTTMDNILPPPLISCFTAITNLSLVLSLNDRTFFNKSSDCSLFLQHSVVQKDTVAPYCTRVIVVGFL